MSPPSSPHPRMWTFSRLGSSLVVLLVISVAHLVTWTEGLEITTAPIQENTTNAVTLVTINLPNRTFVIVNSSVPGSNLFEVTEFGQLRLRPGLPEDQRKLFDFETHPDFKVYIQATNLNYPSDVEDVWVTIPLIDVNDEKPKFTTRPLPYLAVVSPNPTGGTNLFTIAATDPDTESRLEMIIQSVRPEPNPPRFRLEKIPESDEGKSVVYELKVEGNRPMSIPANPNQEYTIQIQAIDRAADRADSQTESTLVYVKVGTRPPQIYESIYVGQILETSTGTNNVLTSDGTILVVKAKLFQQGTLTREILDAGVVSQFYGFQANGQIVNLQPVLYDTVATRVSNLIIRITENAGTPSAQSTEVSLTITVMDDNDNVPKFSVNRYQATVREDVSTNTVLVTVIASDRDSGQNGRLSFSVSDDNFQVDTRYDETTNVYTGDIKPARPLDYERSSGSQYTFIVTATDKGIKPKSSTANVVITTKNVNDNAPVISGSQSATLLETAQIGTVVFAVEATDPDGDLLTFSIEQAQSSPGVGSVFSINLQGVVTYEGGLDRSLDYYTVMIRVRDDGSCCGRIVSLYTDALYNITIIGVNRNSPTFENCSTYDSTSVKELSPVGTPVVTVHAKDDDRGLFGEVHYTLQESSPSNPGSSTDQNPIFQIDSLTGNITVRREFERTRARSYVQVTVIGRNPGESPLEGRCTFRITINDINNHAPTFSVPEKIVEIPRNAGITDEVTTVQATDEDIGRNADITYSLTAQNANHQNMFTINGVTGQVLLASNLLPDVLLYDLTVNATDDGVEPNGPLTGQMTLKVNILGNENMPSWEPLSGNEFFVDEVVKEVKTITTLYCNPNTDKESNVQILVYENQQISSRFQYSVSSKENNLYKVELLTLANEFQETEYTVIVACQLVMGDRGGIGGVAEIPLVIKITDVNNQAPRFEGVTGCCYISSIPEDAQAGAFVTEVSATDADRISPYNEVTFNFTFPTSLFTITNMGNNRARITVTPTLADELDRETVDRYSVSVTAKDGAVAFNPVREGQPNTAQRTVYVNVTDVNDNFPYFEKLSYNCTAMETLLPGEVVCTVKAEDKDLLDLEGLRYFFRSGNVNNAFTVRRYSGDILVSGRLDYESPIFPKVYNLVLVAVDNANHENETNVRIFVENMNDNRPVFDKNLYEVKDKVTEHDQSISPENPVELITVRATDADVGREGAQIRYSLSGTYTSDGNDQKFKIDPISGVISVIRPLDREENLDNAYTFLVLAEDEPIDPQTGYATVQVFPMDINDNKPVFEPSNPTASVKENTPSGTNIGQLVAFDRDDGENAFLRYGVFSQQVEPTLASYFRIDPKGTIFTNTDAANLDRERYDFIPVIVMAYDNGSPTSLTGTATLTVSLLDENDESPFFEQEEYRFDIPENQAMGPVETIAAVDNDVDPINKRLIYSVSSQNYFGIDSVEDKGIITLVQELDHETGPREFNFTITVTDNKPGHSDTAKVHFTVLDFNDEYPIFVEETISVDLREEEDRGQYVATFAATDRDSTPPNNIVRYSIDPETDPFFEFFINPISGNVTTRKPLDHEKGATRNVHILATDQGNPPLSATATLIVNLENINDNGPRFKEDYRPKVEENTPYDNHVVEEVMAIDPDGNPFAGPFYFQVPADCNSPACQKFNLEYQSNGDRGEGSALIRTSQTFDREAQKEYHLPIIIIDMYNNPGNPNAQSSTNTLTIVVGDKNDNELGPGHQDIFVYVLGNETSESMQIGRVYATDLDDWDLPDKTFTNISPPDLENYFLVDQDTGEITLKEEVPLAGQPYTFSVRVFDSKYNKAVTCTVSVTLAPITDQAIRMAGTVKLGDITAEEFIKVPSSPPGAKSRFDKFKNKMAEILGYTPETGHVEIVTLTQNGEDLDVRYAAHGSPYLNPAQMESAVMLFQPQLQNDVGVNVKEVPVSVCREEVYLTGCYADTNVTGRPSLINANGTSFVGAEVIVTAKEGCVDCKFPLVNECTGDYCLNGGTCIKDDWDVLSCECLDGFDGPRCQQRHHSFDGKSVAFYHPPEACATGRTSIEFITEQENGIILYSGPITSDNMYQDHLVLELVRGYPKLMINLGFEGITLTLTGRNRLGDLVLDKLNDGKWHHIDIDRTNQEVVMTVDECEVAQALQDGTVPDWSSCRVRGIVPGGDVLLNAHTLLQVGGRYPQTNAPAFPPGVGTQAFNGCLRNLMHNTKLYDLSFKDMPNWDSGVNGCPREEQICGAGCGATASCESQWLPQPVVTKCTCHPGYYGANCAENVPVRDLKEESFMKWSLETSGLQAYQRDLDIDIMFRTRQDSGNLFTVTSTFMFQILLQLVNGRLSVSYDFGLGPQTLTLTHAVPNNGQWHQARLKKRGNQVTLAMDGGEGRSYGYTPVMDEGRVILPISPYVSAGARIPAESSRVNSADVIQDDLVSSCLKDIRLSGSWLPMNLNTLVDGATLVQTRQLEVNCTREDCVPDPCTDGECFDLWEAYECRCPGDLLELATGTCPSMCIPNPCFNDVPCATVGKTFTCECPDGWRGQTCALLPYYADDDDSALGVGPIIAIVLGILLLLILVILLLLWLYCRREKDEKMIVEVDPDDDFIRENVMFYDEEGAGEKDHDGYDVSVLYPPEHPYDVSEAPVRPVNARTTNVRPVSNHPPLPPGTTEVDNRPNVGKFIDQRLADAEDPNSEPLEDSLHAFNFEGGNSDAGSLSSLNTESTDKSQDYDFLSGWGDKFARLADMYGAGQNNEEFI